jgi:hypothetical protein
VDAIAILRNRTAAVTAGLVDIVRKLDGVDLVRPVAPGTSPLGLTLWHVPRAQDWLVQGSVRGVPEVAENFLEGLPDPELYGFGTGLSPEQAKAAAAAVDPNRLVAYATAVREEVDAWLASLSEEDLDAVPPFAARQASRAAYSTPEALLDVASLDGLTTGVLLLRPATTHVFRHLGEVEALLAIAHGSRTPA